MGFLDELEPPAPNKTDPVPDQANPAQPAPAGFLESLDHAEKNKPPQQQAPAPSWSQVPAKALVNAPESALEFGKNLVHPFLHPIDTAKGLGNLGLGLLEKGHKAGIFPAIPQFSFGEDTSKREETADALGKMLVERYGSEDGFKRTLAKDPVGVLGDMSVILTGGGGAAARLPGIAGKVGEVAATTGRVIDPLNAITTPVKLGAGFINHTVGVGTGAGHHALEEAARAGWEGGAGGKNFKENLRGEVPLENVVADARQALDNMRRSRGADYEAGMKGVAANQNPLPLSSWRDIYNAIHDAEAIKTFKGQTLDPLTEQVRAQLKQVVTDWTALPAKDFHTAEGMDALKRKIGNVRDHYEIGSPERAVADIYYNAVRNTIHTHVPQYAAIMEGFGKASDTLREIEKSLSLPRNERKVSIDTSLRKLQSVMRNNVNTNYGQRAKMVEYLEQNGSPHLMKALAGQALNSWTPRGLSRLAAFLGLEGAAAHAGHTWKAAALLPFMSPRMMGEAYYGIGAMGRLSGAKFISPAVNKPVARTLQQTGRIARQDDDPAQRARGGAVDRALRATKRKEVRDG